MNKKVLAIVVALLAVVVSASSIGSAFAETKWIEHATVSGGTRFDVPGEDFKVQINFAHFDWGDHGARDNVIIYYVTPSDWPMPYANYALSVGAYSDTDEGADYLEGVVTGLPTVVETIGRWQLQVYKIGKTAIAVWTVPLEIPELYWPLLGRTSPAITIPPGCLILKGYGCPEPGSSTAFRLAVTWTKGYDAYGFLACPRERYWGRVGGYTAGDTTVHIDQTFTATVPIP